MKPKTRSPEQDDLLRSRLTDMIDLRHELVKLAALIDWEVFEREWAGFFPSGNFCLKALKVRQCFHGCQRPYYDYVVK